MSKTKKGLFLIIISSLFISLICGLFLYVRSESFANHFKHLVFSELTKLTGYNVTADQLRLNPFPLFIQINNLAVSDEKNNEFLFIKRSRLYIKLTEFLRQELTITRASLDGLRYESTLQFIRELTPSAQIFRERQPPLQGVETLSKGPLTSTRRKINIENIILRNGEMRILDAESGISIYLSDIKAEGDFKGKTLDLKDFKLKILQKKGRSIQGKGGLKILLSEDGFRINDFHLQDNGLQIKLKGLYSKNSFDGSIKTFLSMERLSSFYPFKSNNTGEIELTGKFTWKKPEELRALINPLKELSVNLTVKGRIYLETLMEILNIHPPLMGLTSFTGEVSGPILNPVAELKAKVIKGHIYSVDVERAVCRILYEEGVMRFFDGKVDTYNGKAEVEVAINLPKVTRYSLKVKAESLDSKNILELIKWDPGLSMGKVSGTLISEGKSFAPYGQFRYRQGTDKEIKNIKDLKPSILKKIQDISGSFRLNEGVVMLKNLKISSEKTVANSEGEVDLRRKRLQLLAFIKTERLSELYKKREIDGKGEFNLKISNSIDDPLISGKVKLCKLSYMHLSLGCLDADIEYRKKGLSIKHLEGAIDKTAYALIGKIDSGSDELFEFKKPRISLQVGLSKLSLKNFFDWLILKDDSEKVNPYPFLDQIKGNLSGNFILKGYINNLRAEGSIAVEKLTAFIPGEHKLTSDLIYTKNSIILSNLLLQRGASKLAGRLTLSSEGKLKSDKLKISLLSKNIPWDLPFPFTLSGEMILGGTFSSPSGELKGVIKADNIKGLSAGIKDVGFIKLILIDRKLSLNASFFDERLNISGNVYTSNNMPWSADITINDSRYDDLLSLLQRDIPEDTLISMKGTASLSGTIQSIKGDCLLSKLKVRLYDQDFINNDDISFSINDTKLSFKSFSMKTGIAILDIKGGVDFRRDYNLKIEGTTNLNPLQGLIPKIDKIRGEGAFLLSVTGDKGNPVVNGRVSITDASISIKDFPYRFQSLNASIRVDENNIIIENMSSKFAYGIVKITGGGEIKGWKTINYNLEASVRDINIEIMEGAFFKLSGELFLVKRDEIHNIVGDLKVLKGRYLRTIDWKRWILKTRQPIIKKKSYGLSDRIELNIGFYGDEDILIENNLVSAPARIDILILGTLSSPSLLGNIELIGGKIFFRNNEFKILNASANFTDITRINPYLDINAQSRIRDYKIYLSLEGQIDQFTLNLLSDPFLDEVDIFSLLTVGEVSSKLKGLKGGIGAAEAASFLTGELQNTIEERVKTLTGIDRIQLEPYVSESTGTVNPRLTVSKKLLSDRAYVTYTTSTGNTSEDFLKIEFSLTDKVSLVGERNELGMLGADIKFRLEFR